MQDTDARTPTDPPRPGGRDGRHRPGRSARLVLVVALVVAAGVGAVHGGDRRFVTSTCDALQRTGSAGDAGTRCATAVAADSR